MTDHSPSPRPSTARSNITRGIAAPVGDSTQTRRSLEQTVPWKYVGYHGYSRFISSDDDFFILRRFSVLNVRISLALQNQLVMLERQLNELDNKYEGEPQIHNGRFEGDEKDREELISCIEEKLRKYSRLIQHMKRENMISWKCSLLINYYLQMSLYCSNPLYGVINQPHHRISKAFSVGMPIMVIVLFAKMSSNICIMAVCMDIQMAMSMLALRQKIPRRYELTATSFA